MLISLKTNDSALALQPSCCQRWYRWVRARRKSTRRRRRRSEAPLTAPDRKSDMESPLLMPPSSITLPPSISPSISLSCLPLSLMDDLYSTYDSPSRLTGRESMLESERERANGGGSGRAATCFPLVSDHLILQRGRVQSVQWCVANCVRDRLT